MRPIVATALFALSITACGGPPTGPAASSPSEAEPTPVPPQTCEQARAAVEVAVFSLVAEHASGCSIDGDCILVSTALPCLDGCETAVLALDSAPFLEEFESYGAVTCATLAGTCGSGPSCPAAVPRCVNGGCRPAPL